MGGFEEGDRIVCSQCSLWRKCSYYREGSVCTVPGSEGKKLASFFETRNADTIAEGMRSVAHKMAEHVDEKLQNEVAGEEYDNKTKDLNQLFGMASKLHGIERPKGPGIQVNVGIQNNPAVKAVASRDSRALASQVMKELVAEGYKPDEVTDEMIETRIKFHTQLAINAGVIDAEVEDDSPF